MYRVRLSTQSFPFLLHIALFLLQPIHTHRHRYWRARRLEPMSIQYYHTLCRRVYVCGRTNFLLFSRKIGKNSFIRFNSSAACTAMWAVAFACVRAVRVCVLIESEPSAETPHNNDGHALVRVRGRNHILQIESENGNAFRCFPLLKSDKRRANTTGQTILENTIYTPHCAQYLCLFDMCVCAVFGLYTHTYI